LKSGFATQHRFTWPFLADWVLKKKTKFSTMYYYSTLEYMLGCVPLPGMVG
jgi:hypothetical protein